jgi:hypothetical protein
MIGMGSRFSSRIVTLAIVFVALGAVALSCGSVSTVNDAAASGAAGSSAGGTGGNEGTTGTGGVGVTDGGPITCRTDVAGDCPTGFTCACGGPGPGVCTCHRNCNDVTACGAAEPMCGCPSSVGGARFCVNACFCSCQ